LAVSTIDSGMNTFTVADSRSGGLGGHFPSRYDCAPTAGVVRRRVELGSGRDG
jgi:hypothetical protein